MYFRFARWHSDILKTRPVNGVEEAKIIFQIWHCRRRDSGCISFVAFYSFQISLIKNIWLQQPVNTCTFVCWGTVWPAFFKHASNLDAHCQGLVLPLIFSSVVSGKSMSPRRLEFFGLTTLPFWTLPRRLEFFGLTTLSFRTLQLARAFGLRVAGLFFVAAAAGAAYE